MNSKIIAASWGVLLAIIHWCVLYFAYTEPWIRTASWMLTGDPLTYAIQFPLIVDAVGLTVVLTSTWWLPFMLGLVDKYAMRW